MNVCHMNFVILFSKRRVCFSPLSTMVSQPLPSNATYESHDEKNMRLKRPLSPHLSIYQPQLTWVLSGTHRTTGIMLASYAMFLGLGKMI